MRPCLDCGTPTEGTRCPEHTQAKTHDLSATARGYDARWQRLSTRARRLQPWCLDCGTTDDLTGDHLQWPATKLEHVAVVCRACNTRRGAARGERATWGAGARRTAPRPPGKASSRILTEGIQ